MNVISGDSISLSPPLCQSRFCCYRFMQLIFPLTVILNFCIFQVTYNALLLLHYFTHIWCIFWSRTVSLEGDTRICDSMIRYHQYKMFFTCFCTRAALISSCCDYCNSLYESVILVSPAACPKCSSAESQQLLT